MSKWEELGLSENKRLRTLEMMLENYSLVTLEL